MWRTTTQIFPGQAKVNSTSSRSNALESFVDSSFPDNRRGPGSKDVSFLSLPLI